MDRQSRWLSRLPRVQQFCDARVLSVPPCRESARYARVLVRVGRVVLCRARLWHPDLSRIVLFELKQQRL